MAESGTEDEPQAEIESAAVEVAESSVDADGEESADGEEEAVQASDELPAEDETAPETVDEPVPEEVTAQHDDPPAGEGPKLDESSSPLVTELPQISGEADVSSDDSDDKIPEGKDASAGGS